MGDSRNETKSSFINRLRGHEKQAWNALVDEYTPDLYRMCRQSGLRKEDACDIVQLVLTRVFRKIGDFDRIRKGSFRRWLKMITRNAVVDFTRKRKRRPPLARGGTEARQFFESIKLETGTISSVVATPKKSEVCQLIDKNRRRFGPTTWSAFWQLVIEGRTMMEVSKSLNLRPGAVRQAKYRVMQALRAELGDLFGKTQE